MRLKSAAKYFDTCPVYDAYSGNLLFKVQTSTFLESAAEGSTAARRVISIAPNLNIPTHNCILAMDQLWVVGANNPDEWNGSQIRKAYWTKRVTDNFKLLTPGQAALSGTGTPVFGSKQYLKDTPNSVTDAELDPMWDIAISANSAASRGYFLKSANTLYRIRVAYNDLDGFLTCQSDEVYEKVVYASIASTARYNPVTDKYNPTIVTTTAVLLDYYKSYVKTTATGVQPVAGDLTMILAKAAVVVSVGQEITIQESRYKGTWRVLAVTDEHDALNLHIRRV